MAELGRGRSAARCLRRPAGDRDARGRPRTARGGRLGPNGARPVDGRATHWSAWRRWACSRQTPCVAG